MLLVDKIFIINLNKNVERLSNTIDNLKKINITQFDRFPAIFYQDNFHDKIQCARMGCTLSHLNILRYAYIMEYKHILVVEDDCEFIDEYVKNYNFNDLKDFLNKNEFDLFYLGGTFAHFLMKFEKYSKHVDKINGKCLATHAFIINVKPLIQKLMICFESNDIDYIVDNIQNLSLEKLNCDLYTQCIDGMLNQIGSIRKYASDPILAVQRPGYSDIEQGYRSYEMLDMWKKTKELSI